MEYDSTVASTRRLFDRTRTKLSEGRPRAINPEGWKKTTRLHAKLKRQGITLDELIAQFAADYVAANV